MESELPAKKESPSSSPKDLSTDRQAPQEGNSQALMRSSEEPDAAKIPATTCQTSAASAVKPIATTVHGVATSIISEVIDSGFPILPFNAEFGDAGINLTLSITVGENVLTEKDIVYTFYEYCLL
ncbi:unnamed protein product [Dibothriocephalus latus]|uniref:Uncharacterized protein n=1 Tax=Dibothriocephalus latus TaxID=60516 RepID=A0A3P6V2E9_DIBLA|nr:unnamed protein product [Dibothriocephalus latus]